MDASNSIPLFVPQAGENDLVASIIKEESDQVAGVVFLTLTNKTLKYKIRDRNSWNTLELYVRSEGK